MRVTAKGEYATQAVLHLSLQYLRSGDHPRNRAEAPYSAEVSGADPAGIEAGRDLGEPARRARRLHAGAVAPGDIGGRGAASGRWRVCGVQLRAQRGYGRGVCRGRELRIEADLEGRSRSSGENFICDYVRRSAQAHLERRSAAHRNRAARRARQYKTARRSAPLRGKSPEL